MTRLDQQSFERELRCVLRAYKGTGPQPSWRCPDDVRLAAFVDHRLPEKVSGAIADHLAGCIFCREHVADLVRVQLASGEEEGLPTVSVVMHAARTRAIWWSWAATSVTTCAALAFGLWLRQMPEPVTPTPPATIGQPAMTHGETVAVAATRPASTAQPKFRNGRTAAVLHVLAPEEGVQMRAQAVKIRWTGVEQAEDYEVRLLSETGDVVWQSRTEGVEIAVPPEPLAPGKSYFVLVRAYLRDGTDARTRARGFSISAR